jgi:hypothetical protein
MLEEAVEDTVSTEDMYDLLDNLGIFSCGADTLRSGEDVGEEFTALDWSDFVSFMAHDFEDQKTELTSRNSEKEDGYGTDSTASHVESTGDDEGSHGKRKLSSGSQSVVHKTDSQGVKRIRVPTLPGDDVYDVTNFPGDLMDAINTGHYERLCEVMGKYMVEDCSFQTDPSENEIYGRQHIIEYYQYLFEKRPDMVLILKMTAYTKRAEMRLKFYVTFSSLPVPERSKYTSRMTSFLSKMDFAKLSTEEIKRLVEREREFKEKQQRVKVAGKGEMMVRLNRFDQISKLSVQSIKILSYDAINESESS